MKALGHLESPGSDDQVSELFEWENCEEGGVSREEEVEGVENDDE